MYAVDDETSYTLAMREALALGTAAMSLRLSAVLLNDPRVSSAVGDADLLDIEDVITMLEHEKEWRMSAIAEYQETAGITAERRQRDSVRGPM